MTAHDPQTPCELFCNGEPIGPDGDPGDKRSPACCPTCTQKLAAWRRDYCCPGSGSLLQLDGGGA